MATLAGSFNGLAFGTGTRYHVSGDGLEVWDVDDVESRDLPRLSGGFFPGRDRRGGKRIILTLTLIADTPAAYDTLVSDLIDATEPGAGDNLLTAHQASLEDSTKGTTGWQLFANAKTLARTAGVAAHGSASVSVLSTAAGAAGASTLPGTSGVPVVAGRRYTGLVSGRVDLAGRTLTAVLQWYNASGALLSETYGTGVTSSTGSFVALTVAAAAPAGATYASLVGYFDATAVDQAIYLDRASIHQGSNTAWTEGGKFMRRERPLRLMGNTVYVNVRPRRRIIPIATDHMQRTGVATIEFFSTSPNVYSGAP